MMGTFYRFMLVTTLAAAALLPTGCITAGADVKRDINDLRQSSYQSRKDIDDLKAEVQRLKQAQADIPKGQSLKAMRSSQTELLSRLNSLHEEVQNLMSKVERELNESRKLTRQTAADLDVVKASAGSGNLEKRLGALEVELALIKKKLDMRSGSQTGERSGSAPANTSATAAAEDEYKAAYELYKNKKYSRSRDAFEGFLKRNSSHKWAGNAQFWIGESHYAEGVYDRAILSYDDVVRKYPKSNKVPDAMLKQGYAFIKLKDPLAAKGVLRGVVQKYPDSRAAKSARAKLKTLK